MTAREIIAAYEKREREAGGVAQADPRAIAAAIAAENALPYSRVREVLSVHFTMGGAG